MPPNYFLNKNRFYAMMVYKEGKCKKQTQSKGVHRVYWEDELFQMKQLGNKTKQLHT